MEENKPRGSAVAMAANIGAEVIEYDTSGMQRCTVGPSVYLCV